MNQTQTPSEHPKLDALIAGYLEAVERGENPDRNQIIAENPDIAVELRAFFDDLDRVQRAAASPHDGPAPPKPDAAHASTVIRPNNEPTPGVIIAGRYKLLENIGEGGMGSVWVAEQLKPVKRKVAIKLIKPGMDSKQVLARFEAERQALAVMDHPNIAKVFDGGLTEHGRPYFVMEYVKGVPFTDYCDRARLPLKDRLALFIAVCSAVQHAHQKGIVHRDLKPSNILICLYDGHPVPKVIDFGLAKAMHQPLTEQSIFTGHGVMVGTPLYMSPEQAEHNNLDIDTRTDIYSLGVVLYELLTGSTPLERQQLQKAAFDEVLRLIKEVEPPRPSLRLSGSDSLASIAAQRSIDPKQLSRSLSGDLDWIAMKALDKERSRRYETANGLARDIERFLNEEPVEACPPSTAYRLKKYIHRHRGQVIAAGVVLATLLLGIIGTTWGLFQAEAANEKTKQALREVTTERDAKEAERKKVEAAQRSETEQCTRAERQLLTGILRPIGFGDISEPAELKALADWSALGDSRLQLLGLQLAFEDPKTAMRIARRAERVIQASVGLSPKRRAEAIELMSVKQRDMKADPQIRVAACWLALVLGSIDVPAFEEGITHLSLIDDYKLEAFSNFIKLAIEHSSPQQKVEIARGWIALIDVLDQTNRNDLASFSIDCLSALAPTLSDEQVKRGWDSVIDSLEQSTDDGLTRSAGKGLIALAPVLSNEQVARGWDELIVALGKSVESSQARAITEGLIALAPRMSIERLTRGVNQLFAVLKHPSNDDLSRTTLDCVMALAPRLGAEQTTLVGDALIGVLEKSTDYGLTESAGEYLVKMAPRLHPEQVILGGNVLIGVLGKSNDEDLTWATGACLTELAPRLSVEQVARAWETLTGVMGNADDYNLVKAAGECLVTLASRLSSEQVSHRWDELVGLLRRSDNYALSQGVGGCFRALAPRLDSERASREWSVLFGLVEKSEDANVVWAAEQGLVALAPSLSIEQVNHEGSILVELLEKSKNERFMSSAMNCLAVLAPRLNSQQITRVWIVLISELEKPKVHFLSEPAVIALAALAPGLSAEQISRGGDALIGLLKKSEDEDLVEAVGECLVALVPRLSEEQVNRGLNALAMAFEKSTDDDLTEAAREGLERLIPTLSSDQSAELSRLLIRVLVESEDYRRIKAVGNLLVDLAPRLSAERVNENANALIEIIKKPPSNVAYHTAIDYLVALTASMRKDQALFCKDELLPTLNDQETVRNSLDTIKLFHAFEKNMSTEDGVTVAEWLIKKTDPDHILDSESPFNFLEELVGEPSTRERLSYEAANGMLDYVGTVSRFNFDNGWGGEWVDPTSHRSNGFRLCLESIWNPRQVGQLLSHPACVGCLRESVLQRFEELLFHNGRHVFIEPEDEKEDDESKESNTLGPDGDRRTVKVGVTAPARRFHNLYDAVAWIEQNWPDFDLETNHPMTWRAGN